MTQILGKAQVSLKDIETDLLLLRRTLRSTNVDLQVRVPLRSENYVPGAAGWNFDLDGNAELNNVTARGTIEASGVFTGTLGATTVNAINLTASQITSGTLAPVRIPNLDADKITSGTFGVVRIPNLSTDKITSGTFDPVRIPNLSADKITTGTLNANNVTITGTLSAVNLSGVGGTFSGNLTATTTASNNINTNTLGVNSIIPRTGANLSIGAVGGTLSISATSLSFSGTASFANAINNAGMPSRSAIGATLNVRIDGNTIVKFTSSARFKKDIADAPMYDLDSVKPRTFRSTIPEESDRLNFGLIAEEAAESGIPGLATVIDGQAESVNHELVGLILVDHVKDLKRRVEALENANG